MTIVLRVLGITVLDFTITFGGQDYETAPEGLTGGGQSGSIERDGNPLSPDDRYEWPWERGGFGFQ